MFSKQLSLVSSEPRDPGKIKNQQLLLARVLMDTVKAVLVKGNLSFFVEIPNLEGVVPKAVEADLEVRMEGRDFF
jgi:hypothetical protein